jgi:hypothetical protein
MIFCGHCLHCWPNATIRRPCNGVRKKKKKEEKEEEEEEAVRWVTYMYVY